VPAFISDLKKNLNFDVICLKKFQIYNLTKIIQWKPSCSVGTDTRTESKRQGSLGKIKKLTVAFRNLANASNKHVAALSSPTQPSSCITNYLSVYLLAHLPNYLSIHQYSVSVISVPSIGK
jgi:hypothetical protein